MITVIKSGQIEFSAETEIERVAVQLLVGKQVIVNYQDPWDYSFGSKYKIVIDLPKDDWGT